jgi:hypothetical protein
MSLQSPQEIVGISYDTFESGVNTVAGGTVSITIYVPKGTPNISGNFKDTYSFNVTDIGKLKMDFDLQTQVENITDFKFGVPSFDFKAHDPVTLTAQNGDGSITRLSEAFNQMPNGYIATIELTVNNGKTYFYAKANDVSAKSKSRDVSVKSVHPIALNGVPFEAVTFDQKSFDTSAMYEFVGYDNTSVGYTIITEGTFSTGGGRFSVDIALLTPTAYDFIEEAIKYYGDDQDTTIIRSQMFPDGFTSKSFSGIGTRNCTVIMAGDLYAVDDGEEVNEQNMVDYQNKADHKVTLLPSTLALRPLTDPFGNTSFSKLAKINNDQLKELFVKLARADAAIFGSVFGESFFVSRADRSNDLKVSLGPDSFISVSISQDPVNPKTFDFNYVVGRELGYSSESSVAKLSESTIINSQGTSTVDINFEPSTYSSIYEDGSSGENTNMIITKVALEDTNPDGLDVTAAPIYSNGSGFYIADLGIEQEYINSVSTGIVNAYKEALGFGTATRISGEIIGIDTVKPYSILNFQSGVHPSLPNKDFRISSMTYDLQKNTIKFDAYSF